jgi:hypothetical protein
MARFAVAGRSTVAPTAVRAAASVFATTAIRPKIIEIGVFNTTTTGLAIALCRFTNATGVGVGLTEVCLDDVVQTAVATGFAGHTADGAVAASVRQASLGAAIGSGVIWTFGGRGFQIDALTSAGVGIICPTGTGQIVDYYIEWEE